MQLLSSFAWMRRFAVQFAIISVALVIMAPLAACGGGGGGSSSGSSSTSSGPVNLTFWSWVPGLDKPVALWNQTHPNIHVTWNNVGAGPAEYDKLFTAIKANNAPDVALVEYQYMPTFETTGGLLDLSPYGTGSLKSQFVPWTWSQVTLGNAIYEIPGDTGPMIMSYRADLFQKYNIPVPTTWAQYADAAAKLHAANPNEYITDFPPKNPGWFVGQVWRAGGQLFGINGQSWKVSLNNPQAQQVASYYPAYQPSLDSPLLNSPQPFFGNQVLGQLFKQASTQVNPNFQWGPTINQVYTDMGDNFANAINGRGTLTDALNATQQSTVTFMKKQGFSVST